MSLMWKEWRATSSLRCHPGSARRGKKIIGRVGRGTKRSRERVSRTPRESTSISSESRGYPVRRLHRVPIVARGVKTGLNGKGARHERGLCKKKRERQTAVESRDVAKGLWIWRLEHPRWKPGQGWDLVGAATSTCSAGRCRRRLEAAWGRAPNH